MNGPIVIAHRGACAYLPEHTLEAKALAYAQGADYLEQDLVMSRDGHLIVLHDIHLDEVTDVAEHYPDRARQDGRYYAIDFTLAEIQTLHAVERFDRETGRAVFPGRFPAATGNFRLHTFAEEVTLIQGLNHSTGRRVGLYPEIKRPAWHRGHGKDPSVRLLEELAGFAYTDEQSAVFVQCFDPAELRRIRHALGSRLPLIQLIADNASGEADTDYDLLRTPAGLSEIATYAQGIGPHWSHLVEGMNSDGSPRLTGLAAAAHAAGLLVHPYTARREQIPFGIADIDAWVRLLYAQAQVDGLFIDSPDDASRVLRALAAEPRPAA